MSTENKQAEESGPKTFKEQFTFEERLKEARKKKLINSRLVPVILEKDPKSKLPSIEKCRYTLN